MTKPTIKEILQILNESKDPDGDPIKIRGNSPDIIKSASEQVGLVFPPDIQEWFSYTSGPEVRGMDFYSLDYIVQKVQFFHEYKEALFLPIAGDSCGNDYVAALKGNPKNPPIVFVEGILGRNKPQYIASSSFYVFVKHALERSLAYEDSLWPFDKAFVLQNDPLITSFGYRLPWENGP